MQREFTGPKMICQVYARRVIFAMTSLKRWSSLIVAVLLIIVIFQNVEPVSTKLLFVTIKMPRAALLFITAILGFILGQVFTFDLKRRG